MLTINELNVQSIRELLIEHINEDNAKRAPLIKATIEEYISRGARYSDELTKLYGNGKYRERSFNTFLRDMNYFSEALEHSPLYRKEIQLGGFATSVLNFDNTTNEYEDGLTFITRCLLTSDSTEAVRKLVKELTLYLTETGNFLLSNVSTELKFVDYDKRYRLVIRGHATPSRVINGPDGMFVKSAAAVECELKNPQLRKISDFLYSTDLERRPDGSIGEKTNIIEKKGR